MIEGCTSPNADNYNPEASIENGTCIFSNSEGLIINEYGALIVIIKEVIVEIMKIG